MTFAQNENYMKVMLVINIDDNTDIESYDVRVWCYNKTTGLAKLYQNVELKPIPQKMEVDVKKIEDIMHTGFQMVDVIQDKIVADIKLETDKLIALGYNQCIDEMLGDI